MPSALIRRQVASASGRLSPATKRADNRLAQPEVSIHFRNCFWRERNRKNVRIGFNITRGARSGHPLATGLVSAAAYTRRVLAYTSATAFRCGLPRIPAFRAWPVVCLGGVRVRRLLNAVT